MHKKLILVTAMLILGLITTGIVIHLNSNAHCVTAVQSTIPPTSNTPANQGVTCFSTMAEAVTFATNGAVSPHLSATHEEISQLLNAYYANLGS